MLARVYETAACSVLHFFLGGHSQAEQIKFKKLTAAAFVCEQTTCHTDTASVHASEVAIGHLKMLAKTVLRIHVPDDHGSEAHRDQP